MCADLLNAVLTNCEKSGKQGTYKDYKEISLCMLNHNFHTQYLMQINAIVLSYTQLGWKWIPSFMLISDGKYWKLIQ